MSANDKRSYASGHFALVLDSSPRDPAYLKSCDGGGPKLESVKERHGGGREIQNHAGVASFTPMNFEIGMSDMGGVLEWARKVFRGECEPATGQLLHADFNLKSQAEYHFRDAWMQEFTVPELNGNSKEATYLKVVMQPEEVTRKKGDGQPLSANFSTKQKLWMNSGFNFAIDGIEGVSGFVNKIDSFTVKQKYAAMHTGADHLPTYVPTGGVEWPTITGTIALAHADGLVAWFEKYQSGSLNDKQAERTGVLDFLAPNRKDIIYSIQMYGLLPLEVKVDTSKANQTDIKRAKFTLGVDYMDITGKGLGID